MREREREPTSFYDHRRRQRNKILNVVSVDRSLIWLCIGMVGGWQVAERARATSERESFPQAGEYTNIAQLLSFENNTRASAEASPATRNNTFRLGHGPARPPL